MDDAKWAYYKNPQKTARATRVFDSRMEAENYKSGQGGVGMIVERPGQVRFCKYCDAKTICHQAAQYVEEGRLTL
jgi:hypothetical protein